MLSSTLSPRRVQILQWITVAAAWFVYILAFPALYLRLGPIALAISIFPVFIAAWFYGLVGGISGAGISLILNAMLIFWLEGQEWTSILEQSFPGFLLLLLGGVIIGRMQDLRSRLIQELIEKDRAAAKYQSIITSSSDGIILVDEGGRVVEWNQGQEHITGIKKASVTGKFLWEVFFDLEPDTQKRPASKLQFREEVLNALESGEGYWLNHLSEQEVEHTDGTRFFIQTRKYPIKTDSGFMIGIFSRDITARKKAEELLIKSEERYRATVSQSADGILVTNDELEIIEWSDSQTRIFGFTREEMLGKPVWQFQYDIVPEENRPPGFLEHVKKRAHEVRHKGTKILEESATDFEIQTKDGTRKTIQISSFPIHTSSGMLIGTITRDISEQKEFERHLQHAATHDSLTDLPNRTLLLDRLDHAIARAQRSNTRLAVLYIDLDNFKDINDSYGHAAGDLVLQQFTSRILSETRKSDTFARISGDEFIKIMETITDPKQAEILAEKIIRFGKEPYEIDGKQIDVTLSIGISYYPEDGGTSLRLIQQADAAMYQAKQAGKNNIQISQNTGR